MQKAFKLIMVLSLIVCIAVPAIAQNKGAKTITAKELETHLTFIASDELMGRNTPSPGLKAAARYLATFVESYGFKPMMPDGSFLQKIPLTISSVDEKQSKLTVSSSLGDKIYNFPEAFGGRFSSNGNFSGDVIFLGYGLSSPDNGWDDYEGIDVTGKIVVILDGQLPDDHVLRSRENRRVISGRTSAPRVNGAAGLLRVITPEREQGMAENGSDFGNSERASMVQERSQEESDQRPQMPARPVLQPFFTAEIRHDVAMAILGVGKDKLANMFNSISMGMQVPPQEIDGVSVSAKIITKTTTGETQNVVAMLEGSDSKLKDEYVFFGAHYDHMGVRNGVVYNGADDDGSGTVSLLELAQAFSVERPKRSVVIVWHTGEEKGLWGADYFSSHCPVPLENVSAQINMDMISRNEPNEIFIIGTDRLSLDLDKSVKDMNNKHVKMTLNEKFNAPDDPNRYYSRSDHYMYARYGVPVVFLFCDVTEDYHRPTDTIEKCDFDKAAKVTKLAYYVGYDVGNKKELLPLNADPNITERGKLYQQSRRR
ncbi:M28 family peptidase [candidate division KSB1 bacterium]